MIRRARLAIVRASLAASVVVPGIARGQTTTTMGTASVMPTNQINPDRITTDGRDLGQSTRPANLNPTGVNFQDCKDDLTLNFPLALSGFTNGQNLSVWATATGDCTQKTDRGQGAMGATCWMLSTNMTIMNSAVLYPTIPVRVRDLVGHQASVPFPPAYAPYAPSDLSPCYAQAGFTSVALTIYFVPLDSAGNLAGNAYHYQVTTDLVGPPTPNGVTAAGGDTFMAVTWSPNTDSDTAGYDVYIDPKPGHEGQAAAGAATGGFTSQLVCPDTGSPAAPIAEAGDDGPSSDAQSDVLEASASSVDSSTSDVQSDVVDASSSSVDSSATGATSDGGCYTMYSASGSGGGCPSTVLLSSSAADASTSSSSTTVASSPSTTTDDSGVQIDSGLTPQGSGGISTIDPSYIYNADPATGSTVSGLTTQTTTIKGLQNGTIYTVVVAAVDGSGNVGLPSAESCDYPAPTNDFWKIYRQAGGKAGGGFCALEAPGAPAGSTLAFAGAGAAALSLARRRSRRRRMR